MELSIQLLLDKGFKPEIIENQIFLKNNQIAVTYNHVWIPCRMVNGVPVCTNCYVNTWEELGNLMK